MQVTGTLLIITLLLTAEPIAGDDEEAAPADGGEEEGVKCYVCSGENVECISLQSYKSRYKLLQTCKTGCAVLLGQTGEIGEYDTSIKFARGCDDLEKCDAKNVHCCKCSSDECNINNYCSGASSGVLQNFKLLQIIIYFVCVCYAGFRT
ncbi:uncharacterized protein LOC101891426 [Musca domestica]|uniref:Uncharacterized protein LOC101891426 n=1 Tax=Musca domestica TaxID=7370 RepID=A0A9J7DLH6_MUSDO|nr:uncharacterized protein LOC101891426 [Musca domestica]